MLAGHYAPAYALKARYPQASLVTLFLAVQAADIAFFAFTSVGIERMRLMPDVDGPLAMDLEWLPYSHSLTLTLIYGALLIGVGYLWRRPALGVIVAAAFWSHWALDYVAHLPDLPLSLGGEPRVGLGLWRHPVVALLVECSLVAASALWLAARMSARAKWAVYLSAVVLIVVQTGYVLRPPLPTVGLTALGAEALYGMMALFAWFIERRERPGVRLRASGQTDLGS